MYFTDLVDRGSNYDFIRPDSKTLYDFQQAAVDHCVVCLRDGGRAVLALDTGLGKTCVVRSVIDRLGCRALVVVPGGLVQQVSRALRRYPWENTLSSASLSVAAAETGRELAAALASPDEAQLHRVLVVNRALRFAGTEMRRYNLLVVDEVHQRQSLSIVKKLGGVGVSTLFVTATPDSSWVLPIIVIGRRRTSSSFLERDISAEWERLVFSVRKNIRALELLGMAKPRLVLLDVDLPNTKAYDDSLINLLRKFLSASNHFISIRALRMGLAVARTLRRLRSECVQIVREALQGVDHDRVAPGLLASALEFVSSTNQESEDVVDMMNIRSWACVYGTSVCPCCGLAPEERDLLARLHRRNTEEAPPLWTHDKLKHFSTSSVVVRFPTKTALESAINKYPIPSHINYYVLTSDQSAASRARIVKRFTGRDGQQTKLAMLRRAACNGKGSDLFLRVSSLEVFFPYIAECLLAAPRLLLADATVDVGFDLHRHANGVYVSRLPPNRSELHQVIGRVSRLAPEKNNQGQIDVISHHYRESLDDLILSHLENGDNT